MSSSSSCDCGCEECCCWDDSTRSHRRIWKHPFYSNTVQPLVYYAQVPSTWKSQKSREIKDENPNFFVKAFKWYTQEHRPPQRNQFSDFTPNMTGFAVWLDSKYQQYVRENHVDKATYWAKMKESSSFEPYEAIKNKKLNPSVKKRSRVKSPWRKRRNQNKEDGDNKSQKSHHSFEYILHPKEMTRNVSDWCQPTPTSLRNRSNVTIVSTEVRNCKKTRSLSLTSVQQEKKYNEQKNHTKDVKQKIIAMPITANVTSKDTKILKTHDLCCQCNKDEVVVNITNPTTANLSSKDTKILVTHEISCECIKDEVAIDIVNPTAVNAISGDTNILLETHDISCQCIKDGSTINTANPITGNAMPEGSKNLETRELSCQCIKDEVAKISTGTQYENHSDTVNNEETEKEMMSLPVQVREKLVLKLKTVTDSLKDLSKKGAVRKIVQEFDPKRHIWCQCSDEVIKEDAFTQCDPNITTWTSTNVSQETETSAPEEMRPLKEFKSAVTNTIAESNSNNFMNSQAQTSDHSINLGNGLSNQYPFFMRIVCADKLCDECVHRQT